MAAAIDIRSPAELVSVALRGSMQLIEHWRYCDGYHEMECPNRTGAHASCAAVEVLSHPLFPVEESVRVERVRSLINVVLRPLLTDDKDQKSFDARNSTVKVAHFVGAIAAVGKVPGLKTVFDESADLARSFAAKLLSENHNGYWNHWLGKPPGEHAYYPTAAAVGALHAFSAVDEWTRERSGALISDFAERAWRDLLHFSQRDGPPEAVRDLWNRLPLLRPIASMPAPAGREVDEFEQVFNAYLSKEVFTWHLTSTEDFQKYKVAAPQQADGTDYVSFNTTACLVRSVFAAIADNKIDSSFVDQIAPDVCTWARHLGGRFDQLPTPRRFSYVHQAIMSLISALENVHHLPDEQPMYVIPRIFANQRYETNPAQGFYITPFESSLKNTDPALNRQVIQTYVEEACKGFEHGPHKRLVTIKPVDHGNDDQVIMTQVWKRINESRFAIALCVGASANVYYEIGLAHTLGKPVLLLAREGQTKDDIKFDLQPGVYVALKYLKDSDPERTRAEIRDVVQHFLETSVYKK